VDKYCIVERNAESDFEGDLVSGRTCPKNAVFSALEWAEAAYHHAVHEFSTIVRARHGKSIGEIERELACGVNPPTEFQREDD